jgi:hypothetical protein
MSGPGGSFGSASLYVGTDGRAWCSQYPDELPILTVNTGSMTVTITPAGRKQPGPHVVAFARELAAEVARFVAECERLSAAQHTDETASDGGQPTAGAAA